jgi:hypothetical protein
MQSLLSAVRATGATNIVALGGVGFANYLSRWLAYRPADPLNNLVAAWHVYNFNVCGNASCWDTTAAPLLAQVPVVVTETGMDRCDGTWWNSFLDWLDARQTGYLAWTWNRWSIECNSRALVTDYYTATPTEYGTIYRTHLANLPIDTATAVSSSAGASVEGQAVTFTATVSAREGSAVPSGNVVFAVDGSDGVSVALNALGAAAVTRSFIDDGPHSVVARYLGAPSFARSTSGTLTQQVTNAPPRVGPLGGGADPVAVGTQLTLRAEFTDPGLADTHTASVDWGDGTVAPATVDESPGVGSLIARHAYAAAGVYRVRAIVTDDDGASAESMLEAAVVFDPAAGSARGAGWFSSPTAPRVLFGFLARYQRDATAPFAQPGFRLRTESFAFESAAYDWLVVTGAKAQLHGGGRVNGSGSYSFLLTAIDGDRLGTDVADRVRVKIWDTATGAVFYDTQAGDPDSADPVRALGGGSIAVGGAP